jgi:hypothetical protein
VPRLDLRVLPSTPQAREVAGLRLDCDESELGGVELREPLSPSGDQSLNV